MTHLINVSDLSPQEIEAYFDQAQRFADELSSGAFYSEALKGKIILSMFFENSTRTRTSFDIAAKRLGASVVHWDPENSSMKKDESLLDTVQTLAAMKPDAIIVRHSEYNAPRFIAGHVDCPVINAGDSYRAHPTQALLDALTIKQVMGHLEGVTVAICGDVAHSRVANSNFALLDKLGVKLRVIAPKSLMPESFSVQGIETYTSFADGLPGCDIVMMLRIQKERMDASAIPNDAAYFADYGLTHDKLALTGKTSYVMHPGPMNRGVEISHELADDPKLSLVTKQVANGIPLRMAVLQSVCQSVS